MALTSPALARADLASLLASLTGATVLDYEPFGQSQGPYVSVFLDGYDANFWQFTIRVYVNLEPGAREAQVTLDTLLPLIEDELSSQWGPVDWTISHLEEIRALVAAWRVTAGREDI